MDMVGVGVGAASARSPREAGVELVLSALLGEVRDARAHVPSRVAPVAGLVIAALPRGEACLERAVNQHAPPRRHLAARRFECPSIEARLFGVEGDTHSAQQRRSAKGRGPEGWVGNREGLARRRRSGKGGGEARAVVRVATIIDDGPAEDAIPHHEFITRHESAASIDRARRHVGARRLRGGNGQRAGVGRAGQTRRCFGGRSRRCFFGRSFCAGLSEVVTPLARVKSGMVPPPPPLGGPILCCSDRASATLVAAPATRPRVAATRATVSERRLGIPNDWSVPRAWSRATECDVEDSLDGNFKTTRGPSF